MTPEQMAGNWLADYNKRENGEEIEDEEQLLNDAALVIRKLKEQVESVAEPTFPLGRTWKPGERVELVTRRPYGPEELRPGTVDRIDRHLVWQESLVIAFDDGETRSINPDVMRHIREK